MIMANCEVIRSSVIDLDPSLRWKLELTICGKPAFDAIELKDEIVTGVKISQCKNYEIEGDEVVIVVYNLKKRP